MGGQSERLSGQGGVGAAALVMRTAILATLWWVLAGPSLSSWVVGLPALGAALALGLRLSAPPARGWRVTALPGFLLFFLIESLRGGMFVAAMALRPHLHLRPALQHVDTHLHQAHARMLLCALLSLLPGTLCAGMSGARMWIHTLDQRLSAEASLRAAEARIARLCRDAQA